MVLRLYLRAKGYCDLRAILFSMLSVKRTKNEEIKYNQVSHWLVMNT